MAGRTGRAHVDKFICEGGEEEELRKRGGGGKEGEVEGGNTAGRGR